MKKAKLLSLTIKYFKGIVNKTIEFGDETTITGKNRLGKTSTMDAVCWLTGNVDSTGRVPHGKGGFDMRPHDEHKQPIPGVTVMVEGKWDIDGLIVDLKKENIENRIKGVVVGFPTTCFIDGCEKLQKDYESFIEDHIISKKKLRMLTDIHYFCDKMKWEDRRKIWLEVIGDTREPEGFEELMEAKGNRELNDYKKLLNTEKTGYTKEAKETKPAIKENQRKLDLYARGDNVELIKKRDLTENVIADLKTDRNVIAMKEGDRQKLLTKKNGLESQKIKRESELANDTSNIQKYTDEKSDIIVKVNERQTKFNQIGFDISAKQSEIISATNRRDTALTLRNSIRDEDTECNKEIPPDPCPKCGYVPESETESYEQEKSSKLAAIKVRGVQAMSGVVAATGKLAQLNDQLAALKVNLDNAKIELEEAETVRDEQFEHLDKLIASDVKVKPADDAAWIAIDAQIIEVDIKIGEPVTDQLTAIDKQIESANTKLETLKDSLRNYDNNEDTKKRIKELSDRETELGQLITEIDGKLEQIKQYQMCQNNIIEDSVNKLFNHVSFKLFKYLINEEIQFCCEAHYDGSRDYSTGESIVVGVEIVNVLSEFYGVSIPMFIDNAESLTLPIETDSQIVRLVADIDVHELEVK